MSELPRLSFTDWVVLALIAERPRHGFAVAALTAKDAEIGELWQISQPVVYRAVNYLAQHDLVRPAAVEDGSRGPRRTVYEASRQAREAVAAWLGEPVSHVREMRSELLVKLVLLRRRGDSVLPLAARQRAAIAPIEAALSEKATDSDGFDASVMSWRLETARLALDFLDSVTRTG